MSINELFGTTSNNAAATNARSLTGTTELTHLASSIADSIIKTMDASAEEYHERIVKSVDDTKAMDELIDELGEINPDDAQFLMELDEATIDGILKSQQSKRSRSKSKQMTVDNYRTLMTAAIAENIVRIVTGKAKTYGGFRHSSGSVDFTGAQLEALAEDQNALRKEIRNIQSKKSIMKSKADFSESDERWLALLKAEQQLKDLRVGTTTTQYVEVDNTKNALAELLDGQDLSKMKAADAHELLTKISEMIQE